MTSSLGSERLLVKVKCSKTTRALVVLTTKKTIQAEKIAMTMIANGVKHRTFTIRMKMKRS